MIQTVNLYPGVTLRCCRIDRFKQGALSIQFLQPMRRETAAMNAILPAVLLRGSREHPDMRSITKRLDELYGASVSALVRRIGDCQTTGFFSAFLEDRFAMDGEKILQPMAEFLEELLLRPRTEQGVFCKSFVEGEKRNLIATIESEMNDKRVYASSQLLKLMCKGDSFGLPRLGETEQVAAITAESLYSHYEDLIRRSPVELFYVGSALAEDVAALLRKMFAPLDGERAAAPAQTPLSAAQEQEVTETMEVAQAKLCMGFVTPVNNRSEDFAAMQVTNALFGGGQTSKLFMNIREKMSLCYSVGSGYYGAKGILTVSAGIDADKAELTKKEVLAQLEDCRQGKFTDEELQAAKEGIASSLRGIHDTPGAIENYYSTSAIAGTGLTPQRYMELVEAVTAQKVAALAQTLQLHTVYLLKGVDK